MAVEAARRGVRVFIATPLPGRPGGNRTIDNVLLIDYANRMRAVAATEGAVLVDLYNLMLPDVTRYIGVDGLHPERGGLRANRRAVVRRHPQHPRSALG